MQIQVINGGNHGTPFDLLREVTGKLKQTSNGYPIVYASAYAEAGLVAILEVRALRGERELLVMECNGNQIQAVLEWQSDTEENVDLEDLVIHLVRKDPTQANTDQSVSRPARSNNNAPVQVLHCLGRNTAEE